MFPGGRVPEACEVMRRVVREIRRCCEVWKSGNVHLEAKNALGKKGVGLVKEVVLQGGYSREAWSTRGA